MGQCAHEVIEVERMAGICSLHGKNWASVQCYHAEQTFKQSAKSRASTTLAHYSHPSLSLCLARVTGPTRLSNRVSEHAGKRL